MLSRDPTYLGTIAAVSGAALNVHLAQSVASGLSIIKGQTYKIGQVGSFVRVPQGYQDLFGVVSEVGANAVPEHIDLGRRHGTLDEDRTGRRDCREGLSSVASVSIRISETPYTWRPKSTYAKSTTYEVMGT